MSAQKSSAHSPTQQYDVESESVDNETGQQGNDEGTGVEPLSLDLIFEVLKNRRRRDVIRYLKEREERTSLSDLAEHVAALENDTTTKALTSSQRKRVYVGLYQCHLPKMDDMDIVDFNQDRGHVELGANVDQLDPYLDPETSSDRNWHAAYLAIAAVGVVAVAGSVLAAGSPLIPQLLLAGVVAAFLGCALVQTYVATSA